MSATSSGSTLAWACSSAPRGVVAFLHGYEYATAGECSFTAVLSDHVAKRHCVGAGALGWPDQIARLAERRSLDWMEVYLLISSELLSAAAEPQSPARRNGASLTSAALLALVLLAL
jgi:hypothetical protein